MANIKMKMRRVIDYALVSWPEGENINLPNLNELYIDFCVGPIEPQLIVLSFDDYEIYWTNIGVPYGSRVAASKQIGTKTYTGYKFKDAIVLASTKLAKGEMGFILNKNKDVPTQILE